MLPQEMGRYLANPTEWSVSEEGENRIPTFICRFSLTLHWNGKDWVDVSPDDLDITGYFYLFKKDGSPNTFAIDSLKAALGWNGTSLQSLNDTEWSSSEVQVTVGQEEYKGKPKTKVQFINPRDYSPGGGVKKSDPQQVKSLDAMFGSKLRALGGAPNGNSRPPEPPAPQNPLDIAKSRAWKAFKAANAGKSNEEMATAWKSAIADYFDNKPVTTLGARQFDQFTADGFKKLASPISEEPQFREDEIPI